VARKSKVTAKSEVADDVVELAEIKLEGEEEKKPRATRAKKPAMTMEEIAEKGRGLVPGVTETVAPVKLGILYSQEEVIEDLGVAKLYNDKYEDTDDDDDEDMCYICLCEPCQWIYYSEKVITHMRGVEEQLFVTCRDVNERNAKVRFAGYSLFNQLVTHAKGRRRLPSCVEDGIRAAYPSSNYTGYIEK
jgi:hypothetical protein